MLSASTAGDLAGARQLVEGSPPKGEPFPADSERVLLRWACAGVPTEQKHSSV